MGIPELNPAVSINTSNNASVSSSVLREQNTDIAKINVVVRSSMDEQQKTSIAVPVRFAAIKDPVNIPLSLFENAKKFSPFFEVLMHAYTCDRAIDLPKEGLDLSGKAYMTPEILPLLMHEYPYDSHEFRKKVSIDKCVDNLLKAANFLRLPASAIAALENAHPNQAKVLLRRIIQRKKLYKTKQRVHTAAHQLPQTSRARTVEMAECLNKRSKVVKVSPYVREPIENLTKVQQGTFSAEEKIARLVSYERFVSSLRASFSDTLATILHSPQDEQGYIIFGGEFVVKSANWVISHVLDIMHIKPPEAIVAKFELEDYLNNHPAIKHIVILDDASYSGEQMRRYARWVSFFIRNQTYLHICIPYMTKKAEQRIRAEIQQIPIDKELTLLFAQSQLMLTIKQSSSLTLTWMAHKSADYRSTDEETMMKVTGSKVAIEPYKDVRDIYFNSITGCKKDHCTLREEQLKELNAVETGYATHFVKTNRGGFLLSDSYIKSQRDAGDTKTYLIVENETIPFGGANGAYQWELQEGTTYTLRHKGDSIAYRYKNGQLTTL